MADMVLVVAEMQDGSPKKIVYEMLTAARQIADATDSDVGVAVLGAGLDGEALGAELGGRGADVVFTLDDDALATYAVEPYAAAVQALVAEEEPEVVLFGMTTTGRDLAPRVAAKLRAGLASDVVGIAIEGGELRITRPMYSGQVMATVRVKGTPALLTLRANTFPTAQPGGGKAADVEEVDVGDLPDARAEVLAVEAKGGDRPALAEAARIVSAGRGIGDASNFHLVEALADQLGAAVGTTRAVVDAGWRPYEEQVGQTGKTVSPQLYIALGVSGALQHLSGMRTSKTIVAINKDADAPIFKIADYGIVGDLFQVLPALREAIAELE